MKLGFPSEPFVELSAARETCVGGATDDDVWLTVEVHAHGFSAGLTSVVVRADWERFLQSLASLEETRRGEAIVRSAIEAELTVRLYASDVLGHMAIDARLLRIDLACAPSLSVSRIEFDPASLAPLLAEFRRGTV